MHILIRIKLLLSIFLIGLTFATTAQELSINEVFYRRTAPSESVRFIELYNNSNTVINLDGYSITGDVNFRFSPGSSIPAYSFLLLAEEPVGLSQKYSIPPGVQIAGPWTGTLNLYEGAIYLRDADFYPVDELTYSGWHEWPSSDIDAGWSIQKMHPALPSKAGGAWKSGVPTPGNTNGQVFQNNPTLIPALYKVSHSPVRPQPNEIVSISAQLGNLTQIPNLNVQCEYQIVNPGQYIDRANSSYSTQWQSLTMNDDGINGDINSGDNIYTALIPSYLQTDRRLIRYRIRLNNNAGFNTLYPDQNFDEANYAYYVYGSHPQVNGYDINALNDLQSFTIMSTGIDDSYVEYSGTVITADEVYDHVEVERRPFYATTRRNYRVNFNDGRPVEIENDEGEKYKVRRDRLHFSATEMNDVNSHGLCESVIFKMFELTGTLASYADYTHLRFVDDANANTDFQGIHVIREYLRGYKDFNGDFLKLRDLPDGNIHGYRFPFNILHDGDLPPYELYNTIFNNWNDTWDDLSNGCSSCPVPTPPEAWIAANLDLNNHYNFMAAQEFLANNETNYPGQHNYMDYYNPLTGKWTVIADDLNATFGTPRDEDGFADRSEWNAYEDNIRSPFKEQLYAYEAFKIDFENRVRSGVDLLCNTNQADFLVDNESQKIYQPGNAYNWTDVDKTKWNQNYSNYNTVINDYKQFFTERKNYLDGKYSSSKMPAKPTVNYIGPANFPIDQLSFQNSNFSDPQGSNTFAALEWRIGEWSDPSNPVYQNIPEDIYEITPVWLSGEINTFSNSFTINGKDLKPGHTYRVRVQYKDNTGRKSRWSDPIEFVAGTPLNNNPPNLVISEIMYNTQSNCGNEFIEITNAGTTTLSLDNYYLTGGITYSFPSGQNLAPDGLLVLAADSLSFTYQYGYSPFGQFEGQLADEGTHLALYAAYEILADSLTYNADWANANAGEALELIDVNLDNADPANWTTRQAFCGTPGIRYEETSGCVDVQLYVWLEGAYDNASLIMNTAQNTERGLLPGQTPTSALVNPTPPGQPYNTAPWNYAGTEGAAWTDANYTDDMVDWMLVSFRTETPKSTEIAQAAALLNKDGSLYFPTCALLNNGLDSVYVVIEHRNHMGIMSSQKVPVVSGTLSLDFRNTDSYKDATSFGQKEILPGTWAMFAGDADQTDFPSYDVKGTDKALWLSDNGIFQQYIIPDFNLDGDVNGADKALWDLNNGVSSRVPK